MNTLTKSRLDNLKESGEDFEWYPTTDEIISTVAKDIRSIARNGASII